jgi:hypothetical protein
VESRLARVEAIAVANGPAPNIYGAGSLVVPDAWVASDENGSTATSSTFESSTGASPERHGHGAHGQPSRLELPPLEKMSPTIANFFTHYNSIVPLFDKPQFMRMLARWHYQRCGAEWAAINIVLALGHRVVEGLPMENRDVALCAANVQSMLTPLMMRTSDLLGLQVLLGLVMLFQGTARSAQHRDTPILMGAAMRLVQLLRLSSADICASFPKTESRHRIRLFWIAYILDKVSQSPRRTRQVEFERLT